MFEVPAIVTLPVSIVSAVSASVAGRAASEMPVTSTAAADQPKSSPRFIAVLAEACGRCDRVPRQGNGRAVRDPRLSGGFAVVFAVERRQGGEFSAARGKFPAGRSASVAQTHANQVARVLRCTGREVT